MLNKYAIIKKFVARNFLRFLSLFYYIYRQNLLILSKKPAASRKSTLGFVDILAKSRKKLKKEKKIFSGRAQIRTEDLLCGKPM